MKRKVMLTCALTGGAAIGKNSKYVPITPRQIADEGLAAHKAGAAVLHIHVRDPDKGGIPSMKFEHYREVVERIRDAGCNAILNITTGPGSRYAPPPDNPAAATPIRSPMDRVEHVVKLKPELCTLDIATMNFGPYAFVNLPEFIKIMAKEIMAAGIKPELEVFDIGHLHLAKRLLADGFLPNDKPLFQFCLGIAGGAPPTTETMVLMKSMLPQGALWSGFGLAAAEFPMAAQAVILGGNVRVGLEDNLYLAQGELSPGNAPLVARAVKIIEDLGDTVATPDEVRDYLGLVPAKKPATAGAA
jgi:uncharacterized protein (DUF849 family)